MKKILIILGVLFFINLGGTAQSTCATVGDDDGDGICNDIDPCPDVFNPNPVDSDGDGVYDACDNCKDMSNADQIDLDNDGIGDVCDPCVDPDGDDVCGSDDKCPGEDDNIDIDNDKIPDACDDCIDQDNDGICDHEDDCISTLVEGTSCDDGNSCTINDVMDEDCNCRGEYEDSDGDGVCDAEDQCEGEDDTRDYDNDGIPDACDDDVACFTCDADGDGQIRICHFNASGTTGGTWKGTCDQLSKFYNSKGDFINPKDHCGPCTCADNDDVDSDGDGVCDKQDPCPQDASITKDEGCGCDDQDSDGDGVCDGEDKCPGEDDKMDSDGDGIPNGCDELEYCAPSYDASMEWIKEIQIGGTKLENEQSTKLELHDEGIMIEEGSSVALVITPELIDDVCEVSMSAWIDENQDGVFNDSEQLIDYRGLGTASTTIDIVALKVGAYRIRTMLHYGRIKSACQQNIDGEVEDILISIIGPQPCMEIAEHFEYEIDSELDGASGGSGWTGNWMTDMTDGNRVAILSTSLESEFIAGSGAKLGILNSDLEESTIRRSVGINTNGSEQIYLSLLVQRSSGTGVIDFGLGSVHVGINENGMFYLGDMVSEQTAGMNPSHFLVGIQNNETGMDQITMWINPSSLSPSEADGMSMELELEDEIVDFVITTKSSDGFVPMTHYVDGISISCSSEEVGEVVSGIHKKKFNYKTGAIHRKEDNLSRINEIETNSLALQLLAWPNPVGQGDLQIMLSGGSQMVYESQLVDISGKVVWEGDLMAGQNVVPRSEGMASGVYYMNVNTEIGVVNRKILF